MTAIKLIQEKDFTENKPDIYIIEVDGRICFEGYDHEEAIRWFKTVVGEAKEKEGLNLRLILDMWEDNPMMEAKTSPAELTKLRILAISKATSECNILTEPGKIRSLISDLRIEFDQLQKDNQKHGK